MELTRRGFLGTLTAAMAGFALDPERLLWVPGQKTIFIPPPPTIASYGLRLYTCSPLKKGDVVTWRRTGGTGRVEYVGVHQYLAVLPFDNLEMGYVLADTPACQHAPVQSTGCHRIAGRPGPILAGERHG